MEWGSNGLKVAALSTDITNSVSAYKRVFKYAISQPVVLLVPFNDGFNWDGA